MKALIASPFGIISKNIASHRAAQAVIYADQLKQTGIDVTVNMTLDLYHEDFNQFDALYVYHGNDWSGNLNLFGGLQEFSHVDNFVNFSKFKGKVYSLAIPFPAYHEFVGEKMQSLKNKGTEDTMDPRWLQVDMNNIIKMYQTAEVVNPNLLKLYDKAAMGDSHAISMYRPGWMVNSVPFKTLFGALNMGLDAFLPTKDIKYSQLEFYFGNIDIRHHLMRQEDPEQATRELVRRYFDEAARVADGANVKIYEPLPIEDISRTIPKTGWYEKAPYFGTWDERDNIRKIFIDEALKCQTANVTLFRWTAGLLNEKGQLDFKYMEKPKSVHLSREYYPHWQGHEYNKLKKVSLDNFF